MSSDLPASISFMISYLRGEANVISYIYNFQ